MYDDPMSDEGRVVLIDQFKSFRRREVIFGFFGILFIVAGFLVLSVIGLAPGLSLCAVGGLLSCVAFGMRQNRQFTSEKLASAGPAAIGPLIEALYYDRTVDDEIVSEVRAQTAASIVMLLGSASRQHLLTLTDREAECLYRPYANWSDDFPEYQLVVLGHLIACLDVRAILWVKRLIKSPSFSKHSKAVMQRALICHDLLMAKYTREKASSVLLRAAPDSSPLLRPADGSNTDNSKSDPLLLRPSPHE
jgi:hypothetical protein